MLTDLFAWPVPDAEKYARLMFLESTEPPNTFSLRFTKGPCITNSSRGSSKAELEGKTEGKEDRLSAFI